jgi:hypothetical protein
MYQANFQGGEFAASDFDFIQAGPTSVTVDINFGVAPQTQVLLDCSVMPDGIYPVTSQFLKSNDLFTPLLSGSLTSFNGHLLIPLSSAPPLAVNGYVNVELMNATLFGCQLDTINH